jgi:glutamate synthase domain-containing protein 3
LEEFVAHVWIGHHRYPTKGKVWHPGGAHPFVGLNEALVHNGDFANYSSICEYLAQRDIKPLFLTDTEVSVLLFDLLYRVYRYPLEYVIEALAPTTDRDFNLLPKNKQDIYQYIQKTHMHGSPDGPWFFLIAQSLTQERLYRLIGITDTSMLRPQVFALQKGPLAIGCSASEKQAIDVCLQSISKEDNRFWPVADYYWSARGGSYTDGGAFSFTVIKENGKPHLSCTDKFFKEIHPLFLKAPYIQTSEIPFKESFQKVSYTWLKQKLKEWNYGDCIGMLKALEKYASENDTNRTYAFSLLTKLIDSNYPTGKLRQSSLKALFLETFNQIASRDTSSQLYSYMKWGDNTPKFHHSQQILIINAVGFPAQGNSSLAENLIRAYKNGFVNFIVFNCHGQRFIGNGFGENSRGVTIDVYGSSGDYLASGIDGADIYVHGSGQDQLAQIMNEGTLVIYGDVGQTFMYGAKGGKAFIKGNAAGRPLINAVGKPRVVINGTCLDYLAESFMAGHPLHEGGFVIVNGIHFDEEGRIVDLEIPYPGGNLFSLASGGAVYIRDPLHKLSDDQLNGGQFSKMTLADWELILPYLEENERYFDIPVTRLTQHGDIQMTYEKIYRKIMPGHVKVLQEEELWVKERV